MARALTDSTIKGIKAPASGRVEVADLRCAGLSFRVTAGGVRSWSFRFRDPQSGKDARSTIGHYPDISLGDARKAADALRGKVADGVNPIVEKRRDRSEASSKTFQALADRYLDEHARRFKRSADADERNLRLHVLPKWAKRRYDHIRRADVIELVEGMVKAGSPVQANRVQALISMVFSFAVDSDLMDANPCSRLRKRGVENLGTRVLSDTEIGQFWRRTVLPPVSRRVGLALRLTLLTGCRPGEAAGIGRKELTDLDRAGMAAWLLPSERSKNGRAHLVPLSELARSTILSAIELISEDDEYLFPSPVEAAAPITGHSLTVAMSRLTAKIDGAALTTWKADPPSPHDLRRTVATRLSALGISKEDRDACFNHTPTDVGSRHYDQYERAAEKRRALDAWALQLDQIIRGT
ncbi:integrase arm-type DNA-binding domain-containing protein [Bradyrhizobium sp. 2]|nr:integrase arm-type DNA-binding domain-containing protein [Bradyrhizobium sp. 48]MCK1464397.1 integrase arm-type DNA-binding domain-containing protein [Bradyrhizobium sp. 2]